MPNPITVTRHSQRLDIQLNRAEVHNAINLEMMLALTHLFKSLGKDKDLRLVTLSGNGPSFCAGGDLNWMRQALGSSSTAIRRDSQKLADLYEALYQCPLPLLAKVHGNVMGGGVGLLAVCDWVVAESQSRFCLSEVKLGLVPSIISPYLIRKALAANLLPWMTSAEVFTPTVAQQLGLVHKICVASDLEAQLQAQCEQLLQNAPEALRQTKSLVRRLPAMSMDKQRRFGVELNAKRRISSEGQEGMRAFFDKRSPKWRSS